MREESILQAQLAGEEDTKAFLDCKSSFEFANVDITITRDPERAFHNHLVMASSRHHSQPTTHSLMSMVFGGKTKWSAGIDSTLPIEVKESGAYLVKATCDNVGEYYIDGKMLLKTSDWKKIASTNVALEAGVHMVRIKGENTGGPASLAMTLNAPSGELAFSTRNAERFAPKAEQKSGAFPGEKQIAIPGGFAVYC